MSWGNYSGVCQTHWNLYSTACKLIEHAFFSVSPTVFFVHKIARISVSWRRSFLFASAPWLQHWNSWDPSFGRCARLQEIHGICLRGRIMVSVRMVVWSCGMMAFWSHNGILACGGRCQTMRITSRWSFVAVCISFISLTWLHR